MRESDRERDEATQQRVEDGLDRIAVLLEKILAELKSDRGADQRGAGER